MANNAINNTIGTATSTDTLAMIRSASGQWISMDDQTDSFGIFNYAGDPNGNVTGNTGALCLDTTTPALYQCAGDSSTVWNEFTQGTTTDRVIQFASTTTSTFASTSAVITEDNSIPQSSEGAQVISLAFTPVSATSTLQIVFSGFGYALSDNGAAALFKSTSSNAISAGWQSGGITSAANIGTYSLVGVESSGNTTARTYAVRIGVSGGSGTITFLGGGSHIYGSAGVSYLTITEFSS